MTKDMGIYPKETKSGIRYQVKWRRADGTQAAKNFRSKKEAKKFKVLVEHEKAQGTLTDDRHGKMKFEEFAEKNVFPHLRHSDSTAKRRNGIMSKHLTPAFGGRPISSIRRVDIMTAIRKWEADGLAARTIFNHVNVLRSIFKEAIMREIITRNPMDGIELPKAKDVQRNPLSPEECLALLDAIDTRYEYAIHFVLATGVRWVEFKNMKIGDFKPLMNMVYVRDSKTDAGVREIPLDPMDTLMISQHVAATGRSGADADSPLFTSPEGKPLHYNNFRRRIFKPACEKAGIPHVTFHDLRRTHATMLVAEGHDPKVVQERMGHRSIETTLKYYAKATKWRKTAAANVKNRYLRNQEQHELDEAK